MSGLEVGDRITEITPSGRERHHTVEHVDVEPRYRHGFEGRFVQIASANGDRFVMREDDVLSVDWMTVERSA